MARPLDSPNRPPKPVKRISLVSPINKAGRRKAGYRAVPNQATGTVSVKRAAPPRPPTRIVPTRSKRPVTPQTVARHEARHARRIYAHEQRLALKVAKLNDRGQHDRQLREITEANFYGPRGKPVVRPPSKGADLVERAMFPKPVQPIINPGKLLNKALHATGFDASALVHSDTHPNTTAVKITKAGAGALHAIEHPGKAFRDYNIKGATKRNPATAGIPDTKVAEGIIRAPLDIARATAEDPVKVAGATANSIPKIAAGLIPGIVEGAADPLGKHGVAGISADLKRRYGSSAKKNIRRIKNEGVIPEALDVAAAGSIVGHGLGAVDAARRRVQGQQAQVDLAHAHARGDSAGVAEAQRRVAAAKRPMRPPKRASQDVATPSVPYSRNVFVKGAQKAVEHVERSRRVKRVARQAANVPEGARKHIGDVVVRPGERGFLTKRGRAKAVRMNVETRKGRNVVGGKRELRNVITKGARKNIGSLSKPEQTLFAYGHQGLVNVADKAEGLKWLDAREHQILQERATRLEEGHPVELPKVLTRTNEEIHTINYLRDHADQAFTQRAADRFAAEAPRMGEVSKGNPSVSRMDELMRKGMPQRELLQKPVRATAERKPTTLEQSTLEKSFVRHEEKAAGKPSAAERRQVRRARGAADLRVQATGQGSLFESTQPSAELEQLRHDLSQMRSGESRGYRGLESRGGVRKVERLPNGLYHLSLPGGLTKAVKLEDAVREISGHASASRRIETAPRGTGAAATDLERKQAKLRTLQAEAATALHDYMKIKEEAKTSPAVVDARQVELRRQRLHSLSQELTAAQHDSRPPPRTAGPVEYQGKRRAGPAAKRVTPRPTPGNAAVFRAGRLARRDANLPRASYFPHDRSFSVRYSDYAQGSGEHALASAKLYKGELFRTGRMGTSPEIYYQGLARGIKVKRQWNFVAENMRRYTLPGARNLSYDQALKYIDRHALDKSQIQLVNPGLLQEERRIAAAKPPSDSAIQDALNNSTVDGDRFVADQFRKSPHDFQRTNGWSIMDKAAFDEIHKSTVPEGTGFRLWTKIGKSIPSKIILGTNPVWAILQVVNDTVQAAFAGVTPFSIIRKEAFLRDNPDLRARFEQYSGGGGVFSAESRGTNVDSIYANTQFGRYWNALKQTPFFQAVGRHNPLDVLFRFDNAKANTIREAIFYTKLKRDAYTLMGDAAGGFMNSMKRMEGFFGKDPVEQMRWLASHQAELEQAGHYVDDFMGNFSRYTERERRALANNIMFYGFLRFSLRWLFYTLPVKHPIIASTLVHLSKMHEQEVRDMLGAGPNDPLPPGALSTIYFKNGKLALPLARLSPAENVLTQSTGPAQLLGSLPPLALELVQQAAGKDFYRNRDYRVHGETRGRSGKPGEPQYGVKDRGLIAANDLLSLSALYTSLARYQSGGAPQGDDSLFNNRPTKYSNKTKEGRAVLRSIRKNVALNKSEGPLLQYLEGIFPLIPQPSTVKQDFAAQQKRIKRKNHPSSGGSAAPSGPGSSSGSSGSGFSGGSGGLSGP